MKREPFLPNKHYLISNSGNNSETLFYEAENYRHFLRLFHRHVGQIAILQAFRFRKNQFELILRIKPSGIIPDKYKDRMHQPFANFFIAYTKSINKRYCRTGSLFREHFKRRRLDGNDWLKTKAEVENADYTSADNDIFISEKPFPDQNIHHRGFLKRDKRFEAGFTNITSSFILTLIFLNSFSVNSQIIGTEQDTIGQFLHSVLPQLHSYRAKDSLFFAYEPFDDEEDRRCLIAGDFLKHVEFSAISASATDSTIVFYEFENAFGTL